MIPPNILGRMKTNMNKYKFSIDKKIIDKFRLFTGVRDVEEDKKIYNKVLDASFNELITFFEDNLDSVQIEKLTSQLKTLPKSDLPEDEKNEKTTQLLVEYAQKIENFRFKWDKRLDYFLNQLVYSSINNNE
jgi:hypothetical protein